MTHVTDYSPYEPGLLPPVVVRYLEKHSSPENREAVVELFAADARVVDECVEYSGTDAIRGWLARTGSAYTYTTTFLGQRPAGDGCWVILVRLEGTFPGGVVDLRYQVATEGDRIVDLVVAP